MSDIGEVTQPPLGIKTVQSAVLVARGVPVIMDREKPS